MTISDLFTKLSAIYPHQFEDSILLIWVGELERDIADYLNTTYVNSDADNYYEPDLATTSELLLDNEVSLYIEYLAYKIDLANGEYDRANNHAALFNMYFENWKERYYRINKDTAKKMPEYIRGLI